MAPRSQVVSYLADRPAAGPHPVISIATAHLPAQPPPTAPVQGVMPNDVVARLLKVFRRKKERRLPQQEVASQFIRATEQQPNAIGRNYA